MTLLAEVLGWSLDRTAAIPKSQRFTFGQRVDQLTLDAMLRATRAAFSRDKSIKARELAELGLLIEQLNLLWELVRQRGWISQQRAIAAG